MFHKKSKMAPTLSGCAWTGQKRSQMISLKTDTCVRWLKYSDGRGFWFVGRQEPEVLIGMHGTSKGLPPRPAKDSSQATTCTFMGPRAATSCGMPLSDLRAIGL